ncbi:MAG: VOC family protein [Pseudomonadota bacterium]
MMAFRRAMPILNVRDVVASVAFYERLGFESHGTWGDPPGFCIVQRGNVTLALDRSGTPDLPRNQWWHSYVYVDDAEALMNEFRAAGIETTDINTPTEYGCIDFDVIDPDGHRLAFGQSLNPVPGPGLGHERGRG